MKLNKIKKSKGFSIVELIVVMAIIAALTLISVPIYNKYIKSAEEVEKDALERAGYIAGVAYYADNELTEYLNPSDEQLKPYLNAENNGIKIKSGVGKDNCNEYGHFMWGEYTGNKENFMCVHIVLKGGTYKGAGIIDPAKQNTIVIETYDASIDRQFNEDSEPNVRYYVEEF